MEMGHLDFIIYDKQMHGLFQVSEELSSFF